MREDLATLLDDFRRNPRETAVVRHHGIRRKATTYGELARLAGRFAAYLVQRGIGPGDRVVLWAENSAEWIAAFYGCMLRGVLAVPLDAYGSTEFATRVCADVKPRMVVGSAELLHGQLPEWPQLELDNWESSLPQVEAGPVAGLSAETPLQILFTSGTTGEPKGIVITHGNVLASVGPIARGAQPYLRYERLVHPLRILHTLPLSHVFGQTMGLWVPPIFAGEVHFEDRLVANRLVELIRRERISVLAAVPRVLALLKTHLESIYPGLGAKLEASQKPIGAARRWWRFRAVHSAFGLKFWALVSGGGALAGPLEQFWNGLGFVMIQGYGMTETTALITLNHPFHVARGTIGKPLPGREVKLGPDGEVLVRGASISGATWSGGVLHQRENEWLATGDLAETQITGELRFVGRKSEVIVTSGGVNVHPEDLEAAVELQPVVAACAVVAMETPSGPEPCAVLAMRGNEGEAAGAIERANARLAEFQRIRRWALWPEPDLPRTSIGKVRRKAVAAWLAGIQAAAGSPEASGNATFSDWLLKLIQGISGEAPPGIGDELRLTEDLRLDSLGRVQLAAAIEQRLGMTPESGLLEEVRTLGELRRLVSGEAAKTQPAGLATAADDGAVDVPAGLEARPEVATSRCRYPQWPWLKPVEWLRAAFLEGLARPLVWLLAAPRVASPDLSGVDAPMLIVANHITAFDGPLVEYALPARLRRRIAVAMSAQMLDDFLHFRNPGRGPGHGQFSPLGPLAYLALTALFNVFPVPRRQVQESFAHAGKALDRGFNILVFPEGTRSAEGRLARFHPGIGMLARQSGAAVLPVALRGLGELKTRQRSWFRSGTIDVRIGEPMRVGTGEGEAEFAERLHSEVERLLEESF